MVFYSWLLVSSIALSSTNACIFRSWGTNPDKEHAAISVNNELTLDKETVSIVEQTLVKTLISLGKLKFHCPKENGVFTDLLDCSKFYICTNFNFTVEHCDPGTGYEPLAKTCINAESVPLCQKVQKLSDYKCNETGLFTFDGNCEKFVLCTEDAAFAGSCNRGDSFDQTLKLCLPENEASCNHTSTSTEELPGNDGNHTVSDHENDIR